MQKSFQLAQRCAQDGCITTPHAVHATTDLRHALAFDLGDRLAKALRHAGATAAHEVPGVEIIA